MAMYTARLWTRKAAMKGYMILKGQTILWAKHQCESFVILWNISIAMYCRHSMSTMN